MKNSNLLDIQKALTKVSVQLNDAGLLLLGKMKTPSQHKLINNMPEFSSERVEILSQLAATYHNVDNLLKEIGKIVTDNPVTFENFGYDQEDDEYFFSENFLQRFENTFKNLDSNHRVREILLQEKICTSKQVDCEQSCVYICLPTSDEVKDFVSKLNSYINKVHNTKKLEN